MRRHSPWRIAAVALLLAAPDASAQQAKLRASLRTYDFLRVEDKPGDEASRRDTEFLEVRLLPEVSFGPSIKIESHLVLDLTSPSGSPAATTATARARTYFPLDHELRGTGSTQAAAYVDRLSVRVHTSAADLVVGRQAISLGVNTFWPALDLFAPFAPTRIDREFKPGVDAVRLTVPLGAKAQVETIGAVLGSSPRHDRSGAALLRVTTGPADLGVLGGSFHGDAVAGGFVTANVGGTLLRGEVSWTRAGDEVDRLRRPSFWRGGAGLERQLSSVVNLVAEVAYNGWGERDPVRYRALLASDRMRRGEIGGLGRWQAGSAVTWRFHPLGTLTNTLILNADDPSAIWMPAVTWSVSNGLDLVIGAQLAAGKPPTPVGIPRSEYGSYSSRLFTGFTLYL